MTFFDLQKKTEHYKSVFVLENLMNHRTRRWMKKLFFLMSLVLLVLSSGYIIPVSTKLTGLFFLVLIITIKFSILDAFYYSYVFEDDPAEPFIANLASMVLVTKEHDILGGFIASELGSRILLRTGVGSDDLVQYLTKRTILVSAQLFVAPKSEYSFSSYILGIYSADPIFEHMLTAHGLSPALFLQCALWVVQTEDRIAHGSRWWSREKLETIPSLGRDWAYGKAFMLRHFSTPLAFSSYRQVELHPEVLNRVEVVLTRSQEANLILVGDEGVGKMEVLESLARKAMRRKATPELADKHYFVLDLDRLTAQTKDKASFEDMFTKIFIEAARAGNVLFIIPDMAGLLRLADSFSSDIAGMLSRFLTSSTLQVVAISDTEDFNRVVEPNRELMSHFEKIQISESDEEIILNTFEEGVFVLEAEYDVLFSYPALHEAVASAKRYFTDEPLLDSAHDLLIDSAQNVKKEGRVTVRREDILHTVTEKTGVTTGEVEVSEKDKLMNLESLLHQRVVGQDEAIAAVSNALRRARVGIGNESKPLGSFLFLGPTGVGKTETAKALSEIFFGATAPLIRFDMTEYSGEESLQRMIGDSKTQTPGILASQIREHQYGVLLLDEFEKTHERILDLFLQIIDEGFFTDAMGRKIHARNLIIIATSNAGSSDIFESMNQKGGALISKNEIIQQIIDKNIFKAELINRFDGVILFHPLEDVHLKGIAKVMLERLVWILKAKGITFVVSDSLIEYIASHSKDIQFGARPMNRFIQDVVEKKIVDGMISGMYRVGSTVEFSEADFH